MFMPKTVEVFCQNHELLQGRSQAVSPNQSQASPLSCRKNCPSLLTKPRPPVQAAEIAGPTTKEPVCGLGVPPVQATENW